MKKLTFLIASALTVAVAFTGPGFVSAAEETAPKADNTKMNKQESKEVTADQQKENDSDRETTRQIRKALVKDKSLSMYARNVKIITVGGMVTLKGPVRSAKEKQAVEKAASDVVGKGKIKSELTIKPKKAEDKKKDEKKKKEEAKEKQEEQKEKQKEQQEEQKEQQEKAK